MSRHRPIPSHLRTCGRFARWTRRRSLDGSLPEAGNVSRWPSQHVTAIESLLDPKRTTAFGHARAAHRNHTGKIGPPWTHPASAFRKLGAQS